MHRAIDVYMAYMSIGNLMGVIYYSTHYLVCVFPSEATVAAMSPCIPPTARNVDFNEFGHYVTAYLTLAIIITPS